MEKQKRYKLVKPVFLIGFMGAGKTSVARKLARVCGVASLDMDTYIERREGKAIRDIFAEGGEALFREIEGEALEEIAAMDECAFVSCGGGVVESEQNVKLMRSLGTVVHLSVSADEAASRISDKSTRPLFADIEMARERASLRKPLYESAADATVSTGGKSVGTNAQEVKRMLLERGDLVERCDE